MEIKLNVGILLVLCFIWAGLTWAEPSAALDPNAEATRSLAQLEDRFAHDHGNAALAEALADAYLDLDHPEFAVATLTAAEPDVMNDPGVEHRLARAYERTGRVDDALSVAEVALSQCARSLGTAEGSSVTAVPARGCTERLYASLSMHRDALARMRAWGVTDPRFDGRAALAYRIAVRSARIVSASAE
ncbi:MAG: hypothetical protein U0234_31975 [Sandaracinus sp.]